jgi:hypothetical protein
LNGDIKRLLVIHHCDIDNHLRWSRNLRPARGSKADEQQGQEEQRFTQISTS